MIRNRSLMGIASAALALTLAGCSEPEESAHEGIHMEEDSHAGMDHSSSGEVPDGLQAAENPAFEVGSQVLVEADHMAGMQGMEATVSGAYDTTVYSISYTPEGGEPVEGHKWVIYEELEKSGEEPLEPGAEVIVNAAHMEGMAGVTATIDTAEETTIYTIDYVTSSGEEVTNHMWVTGEELSDQ